MPTPKEVLPTKLAMLEAVCRATICTIQRLYAMLRNEELHEDRREVGLRINRRHRLKHTTSNLM